MINILFFGGGNQCLETINYLKDISKFSKEKFNIKGIVDPQKIDKKSIEEPTKKIKHYFKMSATATRFNWYRDSNEWKPYHHDAAAVKPHIAKIQNFTVGVSFGAERDASFQVT